MTRKIISICYKMFAIFSLITGIFLNLSNTSSVRALMSYYTLQSNVICLIAFIIILVLELLNNIYPTVYTNSDTNYTSGSTSGCFLKFDFDTCTIDTSGGIKYRKDVMQWLCNNKAKILKLNDGRIYLIKITGKPTDISEGHEDLRRISFEWVEIGDVNSEKDLYLNNLSDVSAEWW